MSIIGKMIGFDKEKLSDIVYIRGKGNRCYPVKRSELYRYPDAEIVDDERIIANSNDKDRSFSKFVKRTAVSLIGVITIGLFIQIGIHNANLVKLGLNPNSEYDERLKYYYEYEYDPKDPLFEYIGDLIPNNNSKPSHKSLISKSIDTKAVDSKSADTTNVVETKPNNIPNKGGVPVDTARAEETLKPIETTNSVETKPAEPEETTKSVETKPSETDKPEAEQKEPYVGNFEYDFSRLDFEVMSYDDEFYLTLSNTDFLDIISKAIKSSEKEYKSYGATPVISDKSETFSPITPELIFSIMKQETLWRIVELKSGKDSEKYNPSNYIKFVGKDNNGEEKYSGLTQMAKSAIDYVRDTDRVKVYDMPYYYMINGKLVDINWSNLNAYDKLKNDGLLDNKSVTESYIKNTIGESIVLDINTTYALLNRIIKEYFKQDPKTYKAIINNKYLQVYNDPEDRILWAALMLYRVGVDKLPKILDYSLWNDKYPTNYPTEIMKNYFNWRYAEELTNTR